MPAPGSSIVTSAPEGSATAHNAEPSEVRMMPFSPVARSVVGWLSGVVFAESIALATSPIRPAPETQP